MNFDEWQRLKNLDSKLLDWTYYNKSHREMKLFNKENKTSKTEVHHLMNTPEQIEYNKAHYEMWGYNLDGTFEYGKYVIFVTRSEHARIHSTSEASNFKRRESMKRRWMDPVYRDKLNKIHASDEYRQRMSRSMSGEGNPNYGKKKSEYTIEKLKRSLQNPSTIAKLRESSSKIWKGKRRSDEDRLKMSLAKIGKHLSEEHKKHISDANRGIHHIYKNEESRNKVVDAVSVRDEVKQLMSNKCTSDIVYESIMGILKLANNSLSTDKQSKMSKYSVAYKFYIEHGGVYKWNEFNYILKYRNDLSDYILSLLSIQSHHDK